MDVISIVASVINGGPGGAYNFRYTENNVDQGGGALEVVYSKAGLPTTTIRIVDGFSATTGDSAFINCAAPLTHAAPGFRAEMRLGIGFSFYGQDPAAPNLSAQVSEVTVNGTLLTNVAGHCDDAVDAMSNNGDLITVDDDADPFSAVLPAIGADHEKYDLKTLLNYGDTQIVIDTFNLSNDGNISLAVFAVTGEASLTTMSTLEPLSIALLGTSLLGLGIARRRRPG